MKVFGCTIAILTLFAGIDAKADVHPNTLSQDVNAYSVLFTFRNRCFDFYAGNLNQKAYHDLTTTTMHRILAEAKGDPHGLLLKEATLKDREVTATGRKKWCDDAYHRLESLPGGKGVTHYPYFRLF
jgi:hypothetical protein